ncbi:FAD-dependent oxidoreductase [Arsenicicoccus piscis]|uniref:Sarcosine dehydrogenase n=1 Tax=Arsenicicoccus piscis TaxID=673954 RepID=A0ABQ6HRM4_9MICO|nr:FAD-dependent oxidoreductase [Arsenicicoccus piscis]MCH8627983.1 FAD-dependent oxidoreductase [Arsenicicoccus piscis]GMA20672.1 sarcosine dehydrogenase [Arsenicicoccus piscis]
MAGPQVVIIGAGVVGAALADELTAMGWDQVTVVEQGTLPRPGGSTSHAPGLVFQANSSKALSETARYTVEKFMSLRTAQGDSCFRQVGGLELATTPERERELLRRHGWLTSWGIESRLVDAEEAMALYPLVQSPKVRGALHIPTDGLAKAVDAVEVQIAQAKERGARILDNTKVIDIETVDSKVTAVVTDQGTIPADIVVSCAGIWGPRLSRMVGLELPLTPLAHQMAWTTDLPSVAGQQDEIVRPILRYQDEDLYYRDRFGGIGIGSYLHDPMPFKADDIRELDPSQPMPSELAFTQADFDPAWALSVELIPDLADARIEHAFNGLFSFTPDGMPLCGPSPDVEGFWVAEAVWVTHSAGVGRAMAEWLHDGHVSSFDVHEFDINRFDDYQLAPDYVLARDCRNFVEVYDILHPLDPPANLRPLRTSPFYEREKALGAVFLEASGFERPQWYEANAPLVERYLGRIPTPNDWAARHWSPIVGAEVIATREGVAMYDMTALKHLEVTGPGAAAFLGSLVTANVDKSIGSMTYCLMLDVDGGIRSDVTVTRLAKDRFQVGANGHLDLAWMQQHLPADGSAQVFDVTAGTCCIGLWGPLARDVVQPLTGIDLSADGLKYFRGATGFIGTVPVTMLRLSYVGELGWEIYTTADQGQKLWDTLRAAGQEHGIIAAGRGAFNSLRLEKGYRSFGHDMTFEHEPDQAGVGFAVKKAHSGYVGEEALAARRGQGDRVLACLTWEDPTSTVMGKEPVFSGDRCVGYVTSAAYGYTIGRNIAYTWVDKDLATTGTELTIGYFDEHIPAVVSDEPLFDPGMDRIRG